MHLSHFLLNKWLVHNLGFLEMNSFVVLDMMITMLKACLVNWYSVCLWEVIINWKFGAFLYSIYCSCFLFVALKLKIIWRHKSDVIYALFFFFSNFSVNCSGVSINGFVMVWMMVVILQDGLRNCWRVIYNNG
jgi:hypothetical protein